MQDSHFILLQTKELQDFILEHEADDEKSLVLKWKEILGVPSALIAQQLVGRRKAKHKLPTWYSTRGIIYPPSLNMEQSSSEVTARYKSTLAERGKVAADLTGGFGIDSFYLSKQFDTLYYVEPDLDLLKIVKHNHQLLGATNIEYVNTTAESFIEGTDVNFDLVFIDPSRRSKQQKVFKLADCIPDIVDLKPVILSKAKQLLIKNSPLLDIQQGLRELEQIKQVVVLAVENECKELLFLIDHARNESPSIDALDLDAKGAMASSFSFRMEEERRVAPIFSPPQQWLYEPNAAMLKAGAFKIIASYFPVLKLHPSTHLYTGAERSRSFPGRTFRILEHLKLDKRLKEQLQGQVNILVRNYPLSVEEIKKRTGLREGGELYLICTQSEQDKHVLLAERVR